MLYACAVLMDVDIRCDLPSTRWLASRLEYPPAAALFNQGRLLEEVLNVRSGIIKLVCVALDGRESILSLAFPGAWLGTASVIANKPTPASAITCTQAVISRIPASTFRRVLEDEPKFSSEIHRALSLELCRQTEWLGRVNSVTSGQRLQCVLRQLLTAFHSRASGGGLKLDLPIHHWELASLIGVSPEHLSRLLGALERTGVIVREKSCIVVRDIARLCPECGCDHGLASIS